MKYIIDIPEDAKYGILTCKVGRGYYTKDIDLAETEQLTADYINEHFGDLQDDAYNKGYAQCQDDYGDALKHAKDMAYKRGLEDAWNVARKIAVETDDGGVSISALYEMFGTESMCMIMKNNTVYDATDKLKAYEEKQKADDKIEVGDEVNWLGDCFIVARIFQPRNMKEQCDGIDDDGCVYHDVLMDDLEKTGRHFDIASILEAMKHD